MDQFTYAERPPIGVATTTLLTQSAQMKHEPFPIPSHIVVSAGTGGTWLRSGAISDTKVTISLHVADPTHSVFYDFYHSGDPNLTIQTSSNIEGIGRPRVELSFIPRLLMV